MWPGNAVGVTTEGACVAAAAGATAGAASAAAPLGDKIRKFGRSIVDNVGLQGPLLALSGRTNRIRVCPLLDNSGQRHFRARWFVR
jgi:ABC-type uncharacterized transport system permease subunit